MPIWTLVAMLILALLAVIGGYIAYDCDRKSWPLFLTSGLLVLSAALSGVQTIYTGKDVTVVRLDGEKAEILAQAWVTCDNCFQVPRQVELDSKVEPITENPKVRRLAYHAKAEIFDYTFFLRETSVRNSLKQEIQLPYNKNWPHLRDLVQFQLYEFNNERSQDLAKLYNPLDKTQQAALLTLLQDFTRSKLEPHGVRITQASFMVE